MPVVLVCFYFFNTAWIGLNSRHVISISSLCYGIITVIVHLLNSYVHTPLIFRGRLYLFYNVPLSPKQVSCCIFQRKCCCSTFHIYWHSVTCTSNDSLYYYHKILMSIILFDSTYSAVENIFGYWSLSKEKWVTSSLRSVPYLDCSILFIITNAIHFSKKIS